MKKIILLLSVLLCSLFAKGQDMKVIEEDLVVHLKKILYYRQTNNDSINQANDKIMELLLYYTSKYPKTINYKFSRLSKEGLEIATSDDTKFRIYSWDTFLGGTMQIWANVFQFNDDKVRSINSEESFTTSYDEHTSGAYSKIFTPDTNNNKIYLAYRSARTDGHSAYDAIKLFKIENKRLNYTVKLIKTKSGITNTLGFDYDFTTAPEKNGEIDQLIFCEDKGKTIRFPVVNDNARVTNRWITYRFNGQYFEKVKK